MNEKITSRECIMQLIRTRMASRHAMQRLLRNSNAGITFEMLQIMSCLWSEQGVTQQTLAERTAKDKACLTSLMTNLERKGLVCRHENPKDRRNKLVYLTEKGDCPSAQGILRPSGKNPGKRTDQADRQIIKGLAACH